MNGRGLGKTVGLARRKYRQFGRKGSHKSMHGWFSGSGVGMWVDGRFGSSVCEPINPRTLVHHYCRQIEVNGGGQVDERIRAAGKVGCKDGGFDRILEGSVIVGWRDRQEGLEANDPSVFLADELSGFVVQADSGTVDEGRS